MKKLYLFAALAAMLAACSENDLTAEKQVTAPQNGEETAVQFDAYLSRGTTRAGKSGVLTLTGTTLPDISLQATGTNGFGVFGYYTNGEDYSGITKPNFFYNQQITYSGSKWTYEPLRYWPNEFGGDALSDQVDKVTLFAYAPYADVTPSSGVVKSEATTNIIGMTRNNVTGDPFIKYVSTMDPTKCVDLCYGVAADQFTSSSSSVNYNDIAAGKPYLNVVKPGTDANSKIKFDFKHALAQFVVDINANVKDLSSTTDGKVETDYTRIWVRSVTFTGITQSGSLNLNSNAGSPEWYDINGTNKITTGSLTVYDGRKDEKEAMDEAPNETPATLNSKLVQDEKYTLDNTNKIQEPNDTEHPGVTETAVNLFNGTDNYPVFAIPTGETMRVTIVYDVETVDPNLAFYLSDGVTRGTTVQNTIYKDITAFGAIKAGKKYTLHLHLGMRTVDFDASVDPWDDTNSTGHVDLPSNMPTFTVGSTNSVTVGATVGTYKFAITGFNGSEVITAFTNTGGNAVAPSSPSPANGSGVFEGDAVYTNNTTVKDLSSTISVTGTEHSAPTTISVTQLAHDLGLSVTTGPTAGVVNPSITLGTTASGIEETDWTSATKFNVYKNGTPQTKVNSFSGTPTNEYTLDASTESAPILTFGGTAVAGDVYTITIQTGNATEETVTVTAVTAAP